MLIPMLIFFCDNINTNTNACESNTNTYTDAFYNNINVSTSTY